MVYLAVSEPIKNPNVRACACTKMNVVNGENRGSMLLGPSVHNQLIEKAIERCIFKGC